jgi:chromosome partitioning protein
MATTITFAVQKGGAGKTTTAGLTAYMLSQNYKVLVVDTDSQGNVTELLTGADLEVFREQTILEALQNGDVRPYIKAISETLHIVPADNFFAIFSRWLYQEYERKGGKRLLYLLKDALAGVQDYYDYIIIDTPPALGDATANALSASDHVVILYETSKYCFTAVKNFIGTLEVIQDSVNPNLKIAGLLRSIVDVRRKDTKFLIEEVVARYGEYCYIFDSIITRNAHVGRLNIEGFEGNSELPRAISDFTPFYEELMERVKPKGR